MGGTQVRRCVANVSTALPGVAHLRDSHARCRFEMLFQERGELQTESIGFLLFVKEKLPFGADPQKDEWISAQATHWMETFDPHAGHGFIPGLIGIVRWRGLQFASSMCAIPVPSFRSSPFVYTPEQDPAPLPSRSCVIQRQGRVRQIARQV